MKRRLSTTALVTIPLDLLWPSSLAVNRISVDVVGDDDDERDEDVSVLFLFLLHFDSLANSSASSTLNCR